MHAIFALFILVSINCFCTFPLSADTSKIVAAVEQVNSLREANVQALPKTISPEVFKTVCQPVGKLAKTHGKENNWEFRQASHKPRNPQNAARAQELAAIKKFQTDGDLHAFTIKKNKQVTYYQRINVIQPCLRCHGADVDRPDFIKKKYKQDTAFGFKVGDVRGVYAVTESL